MFIPFLIGLGLAKILNPKNHNAQPKKALGAVKINQSIISTALLRSMPQKIINYISKNFDDVYGSPYSDSFYSKQGQSWNYTPENQIRVSNHWNFWSRDYSDPFSEMKQHSITDIPVNNNTHWTIAQKNDNGIYEVVMSLPVKIKLPKKDNDKHDLLSTKRPNEAIILFEENKSKKANEKAHNDRNKKIANSTQWVIFDRSYTERISSKKFNRIEEKDVTALYVGDTADYYKIKFRKNGAEFRYKKSTISNFKWLKRKPKNL